MKELESFRGHQKDVTALAWHPFHEEYFVSGSYEGSIFHLLVGHENPLVEVCGAHENSVWDLAWHSISYILCSGSNDHTTKFWCRNRPGDTSGDRFNTGFTQGYGDQNPSFAGRATNFPIPDGPFLSGLPRNDGTSPGIGAAMPLSAPGLDLSDHGEQKQPRPAPPLLVHIHPC
ncbi:hypothetical protein AQUCO_01900148v1 [Aquilegia coerulea]|uniref:Uncharacterized protein n=1 Tax=Aquilegia coerulea TaxID=218851 RepID=A0A2G5DJ66_AQUCA|nr:hypothetical protein AQUCO_01900148v1 [Aquilegia coerulea]